MSTTTKLNPSSERTYSPAINSSHMLFRVLVIAGVAFVYFGAAELGLSLAFIHVNVSPVWPPTGVAVAAIMLLGYRAWPGIFLGAFIANFLTPIPLATVAVIAAGNTLEALVAASFLNYFGFHNSFDRAKDVAWFSISLTVGAMVAASIGNVGLVLGGAASWANFGSLWLTWWLGDLVGGLLFAPLLLVWGTPGRHWLPMRRRIEAVSLLILLLVTGMVIFGGWFPSPVKNYPLAHLAFPFLVWAAFRLGQRGVTLSLIVLATIALWGTRHGFGPFARSRPNESLLLLQVFVGAASLMFMVLVAVVEERRQAARTLKLSERRIGGNLAVTRILAESPRLADATPRILGTICEALGWEVGGLWIPTANGKELTCLEVWPAPEAGVDKFGTASRSRTFDRGVGLPGRVWATLKPTWIPDVEKDDNFPRAKVAVEEGLHAAFAFPMLFNDKFLGVMEFFSHEIRQPDNALLAMFGSIGGQIGQFMERKRNEEEREHLLRRELAARAEAELANRTKDEFLAIVSHELRTPLNAIVGWASMLRSGSLDQGRATRAIEVIDRNAKAQAQLIEDILDVSRIVSGNLRLDPRPVQLQQVLEAAVDSIKPAADAKQIALRVTVDPKAGPVSGDPDRLQQVVWNLLSNAVKFTPVSGRIEIRLLCSDSHVEVEISDNGQGISPDFLPHVFDRFRQADGSKTRRHGGLGLGLAIVRNLVELHSGEVKAHSEGEGKGTVFTIRLPCVGVTTVLSERQRLLDVDRNSSAHVPELDGVKILAVEDDPDSREMLELVLRSQGAEVVSTTSVKEALDVLERKDWKPHILISDLGMPEQDGYDLIRKIRAGANGDQNGLPAIAITGYAGNEEGKRALSAGFHKHLTKPISWSLLIEAINELTRDARRQH